MRFLRGISALAALTAILGGVPYLLALLAGNPIPSVDQLVQAATMPDLDGSFFIGHVLPIIGWLAWATFAIAFVLELPAQLRSIEPPRIALLAPQQAAIRPLVAAILIMFSAAGGIAGGATAADAHETYPQPGSATVSSSQLQQESPASLPQKTAAAATTATDPEQTEVVVEAGDSLWGIAESELGDGHLYTELFDATQSQEQPVMGEISDPNLIHPGQVVYVPGESSTDEAPAEAPPTELETDEEEPAAPAEAAATSTKQQPTAAESDETTTTTSGVEIAPTATAPAPTSEASDVDDATTAEDEAASDIDWAGIVTTTGGIGLVLAGGILSVLGGRRMVQRRRRRQGERISMPEQTMSTIELELRAVEEPLTMQHLDQALRHLAAHAQRTETPLPQLYAIRLAEDELSLYLHDAADLPAPFVCAADDRTAWVISINDVPELEHTPSAPFPALVSLGRDSSGAHILVDLEYLGALELRGDEDLTNRAMTALAAELATTRWGENLRVTLVGFAPGLPAALGTNRIRHVDDIDVLLTELENLATETERVFTDEKYTSLGHARTASTTAEEWPPEIILLGQELATEHRNTLSDLVSRIPRIGIAAVSRDQLAGDWALEIESAQSATLAPLELPIEPQIVSDDEYEAIMDLLEQSNHDPVPGPAWAQTTEHNEPTLTDVEIASVTAALSDAAASSPESDEPAPATEPATETHQPAEHDGPYIKLLGTVELVGFRGEKPTPNLRPYVEVATLLTLKPNLDAAGVHEAIWPGEAHNASGATPRRNSLISRTRRLLGTDDNGTFYLPKNRYETHGVRTDWQDWLDIVGDLETATTGQLKSALKLVTGQPISGVANRKWGWSELIREEMLASISDVAAEVARRAFETGDTATARHAGSIGRTVDPAREIHWRDSLRAEHMAGDRAGTQQLLKQFYAHLDSIDEAGEPVDQETVDLIDELTQRSVNA